MLAIGVPLLLCCAVWEGFWYFGRRDAEERLQWDGVYFHRERALRYFYPVEGRTSPWTVPQCCVWGIDFVYNSKQKGCCEYYLSPLLPVQHIMVFRLDKDATTKERPYDESFLSDLPWFPEVADLRIYDPWFTDRPGRPSILTNQTLKVISQLKHIEYLRINIGGEVTEEGLAELGQLPRLKILHIDIQGEACREQVKGKAFLDYEWASAKTLEALYFDNLAVDTKELQKHFKKLKDVNENFRHIEP